jgi:alpha-L-fucosidase
VLAKGGNYLLNVGPKADGAIPVESSAILRRIGAWFATVKSSLLDVESAADLTSNRDVVLTRQDNTLFIHLIKEPETNSVFLHPLTALPRRATLLNTGQPLECAVAYYPRWHNQVPELCLRVKGLPVNTPPTHGWVVKLEFDQLPKPPRVVREEEQTR